MSRNLSQIYVMYEIDRNYFKMRMYKRNKVNKEMNVKRRIYNAHTCKHTNITLTLHVFLPLHVIPYLRHTRNVKETINDANDRAIRSSSFYFQKAIQGVGKVVLITNDADNQV